MGKTRRRNYRDEPTRDGDHAKRCPSSNCDRCVNGAAKKPWRRWFRKAVKIDE